MLTIDCSDSCRRRNRVFIARVVRSLCDHLGLDRPSPAVAWTPEAGDRVEVAIAARLGFVNGRWRCDLNLECIIGHMVLNPDGRSAPQVLDRLILVHRIADELYRLRHHSMYFCRQPHHFYPGLDPSEPISLWGQGWRQGRWTTERWYCACPDELLDVLRSVQGTLDDELLTSYIRPFIFMC
jgi:hypothetical protein